MMCLMSWVWRGGGGGGIGVRGGERIYSVNVAVDYWNTTD